MKRIIQDYLTFSKKERLAVIILLLFILVCFVLPFLYEPVMEPPRVNRALADFVAQASIRGDSDKTTASDAPGIITGPESMEKKSIDLFLFDPNTIGAEGWKRLGVKEKTVHTILNFLGKGGSFRQAEDLRKIWGLSKQEADLLVPYVRIQAWPQKINGDNKRQQAKEVLKKQVVIDVNTATIAEWNAVPGVDEKLAERIIQYRDRLGGFSDELQVRKTYGINDSLFRMMRPFLTTDPASLPKVSLNNASFWELKTKAKLAEPVARAIILYRQQYGAFTSVGDLKKIVFINDSLFQRLSLIVKIE